MNKTKSNKTKSNKTNWNKTNWNYEKLANEFKISLSCEIDFKNIPADLKKEIETTFEQIMKKRKEQ